MKDDQQRSNFVRISNYYKVQFPFPKVSALMYLALNSLHVDERIAFLQVRRADRVQHIGQHIILLGWTTKFCSFPYIILSLLLLLPISLVLSYGCDNVENAASDYSYFFLLQHITAHIADYKKSRARSSTLYRKLFELRDISETNRAGRRYSISRHGRYISSLSSSAKSSVLRCLYMMAAWWAELLVFTGPNGAEWNERRPGVTLISVNFSTPKRFHPFPLLPRSIESFDFLHNHPQHTR